MGNDEIWPLTRTVDTSQPITKKFVTVNYVPEAKRCAKFDVNPSTGVKCEIEKNAWHIAGWEAASAKK